MGLAQGVAWILLGVEVEDFPAQSGQLIEEGLFDMIALIERYVRGRLSMVTASP